MSMCTRITTMTRKKLPPMFDRAAWNRAYNKERYQYYKAKGICVDCGAEWAQTGYTSCEKCRAKNKTRHDRNSESANAHKREQRAAWRAAGLCTQCGKRKARPERCTCARCAKNQHDRDMDRIVKKRMEKWRLEREQIRL